MLTVQEAEACVFAAVPPLRTAEVPLLESLGCVLAEEVASDRDQPPWNKALMDGFAVRSVDCAQTPVDLDVIEEISAGRMPIRIVQPGHCAKIMTGAPLPQGTDAVQQIEKTRPLERRRVRILEPVRSGQNVSPRSEDARAGEILLSKGHRIRPQEIGVLASVGKSRVRIYEKPSVTILSTGDELLDPHQTPKGAQIRNSNAFLVAAQIRSAGLSSTILPIARDTIEDLRPKIRTGLEGDVLILSGGVSAGDRDHVLESLKSEGADILFHQVRIKPGRPLLFGRKENHRFFGLPGNPVSVFVTFEVFVRPFLNLMMGERSGLRPRVHAKLTSTILRRSDREQFWPGRLRLEAGFSVESIPWHGSADHYALTKADSLIVLPANTEPSKDMDVEVIPL